MGRVAAIGEPAEVAGYGLVGALVVAAEGDAAVRAAWQALPGDVTVVVLTPAAAGALGTERPVPGEPLRVVVPA